MWHSGDAGAAGLAMHALGAAGHKLQPTRVACIEHTRRLSKLEEARQGQVAAIATKASLHAVLGLQKEVA